MKTTDLNGEWTLSWDDLRTGSPEQALNRSESGTAICVNVPGSVHEALIRNGIIREPNIGLNANDCKWMETKEWWLIREFTVNADILSRRNFLRLDGVDLTSRIWLNGKTVGTTDNAFIGFRFDVSDSLKAGRNILVIRLDEGLESVRSKPLKFMERSWNREQPYRAWMRKPQYCYGWDWTLWLPTLGLWKGVCLESFESARISDFFVRLGPVSGPITAAESVSLIVSTEIERFNKDSCRLECEILDDERGSRKQEHHVARGSVFVSGRTGRLTLKIEQPKLWWPNGLGRPHLYHVILTLKDRSGKILDRKSIRYGIRTVGFEERPLGKGHKTFTFLVNDMQFFAKGANWVPADTILGRVSARKVRTLIDVASAAHANMLRVWGGGVYESEEFYDACDKNGLLVWQDFMFSCMYYPSHDAGFRKNIEREAEQAIRRLRNRASLFGWAGNNEIQCMYQSVKKWHPDWNLVFYGEDIFEKILPGLTAKLDPDRIYRPGCPYGGYPSDSGIEGDQHTWRFTHVSGSPDYLDLWKHTEEETKFLSEFGVLGPAGIETLRKCISPEALRVGSREWNLHSNSYNLKLQTEILRKYFGPVKYWPLERYILAGQALQAELMRHIFEEFRSRKFTVSGALMWSLSDSFGTNGWSLIDYYLRKKPAYHAFRRALSPLAVTWDGYCPQLASSMKTYSKYYENGPAPIGTVLVNDTLQDRKTVLECRVMTQDGKILQERSGNFIVPANGLIRGLSIDLSDALKKHKPETLVVTARLLEKNSPVHDNRYFPVPMARIGLKPAAISCVKRIVDSGTVELKLESDVFVWMCHLSSPDGTEPLENDFDLIPGEPMIVRVRTSDPRKYRPEISSMNPSIRLNK
jgi:beta-mannosidase